MVEFNYGQKRTEAQAAATVASYVEPRGCFMQFVNNRWGWQSFSITGDTPCAHYVSHQLGLTTDSSASCRLKYIIRVSDLVDRLDSVELEDVQVGDVWARLKGERRSGGTAEPTSHCGRVIRVNDDADVPVITIKHCSSGQRRVAENDWASYFGRGGKFYRLQAEDDLPEAHINLRRFRVGLPLQGPMT